MSVDRRQLHLDSGHFIRCEYCGRFISRDDINHGKAVYRMIEPDNAFGPEIWESYHKECEQDEKEKNQLLYPEYKGIII